MPKFNVHLYAVARALVEGVEADNEQAAIEKAEDLFHSAGGLRRVDGMELETEGPTITLYDAEAIDEVLVDPLNIRKEIVYEESKLYKWQQGDWRLIFTPDKATHPHNEEAKKSEVHN